MCEDSEAVSPDLFQRSENNMDLYPYTLKETIYSRGERGGGEGIAGAGRDERNWGRCEGRLCAVVLLFYVHGKHLRSCRDGQLTLPHFSWAGLDLLSG